MKRKILFFCILVLIDLVLIHTILQAELQEKGFTVIILCVYAAIANFLAALVLSRTRKAEYTGLFVLNAMIMPLLMMLL